jgi:tRNA(Ile)-lysidine synthase
MAKLADRAYAKVLEKCGNLFAGAMSGESNSEDGMTSVITLDKKKLNKILRAHADADLSEMFRLWLSEQGFRFPIAFFYSPKEPAHVKIPHHAAYRKRSIAKIGRTVRICEFGTPEEAQKFVSCGMKEKGL